LDEYKPLNVTFGMGIKKHDEEGRNITVEYESFFLVCTYVPNSGQKLDRLKYRTEEWDPDMLNYLKTLEKSKPVVWTGDLNCAILDIDVHSPKTNQKTAGFTPQERKEFQKVLDSGFIDSFRKYHPDEKDLYT
jgi:exodeoxyribonuclease III